MMDKNYFKTHKMIPRGTAKDKDGNEYLQNQWVPDNVKLVSASHAETRKLFGIKTEEKKAVKDGSSK